MSTDALRAILDGVKDAIAFTQGDMSRGKTHFPSILEIDVGELRGRLNLTQSEFAQGFGVSLGTLRNWEQHRRKPEGPARVLLTVISKNPEHVVSAIWPSREMTARSRIKATRARLPSETRRMAAAGKVRTFR